LAAVPAFADPSISSKKAEAEQVMGQLQQLSDQLERARSQYQAANAQLAAIRHQQDVNRYELRVAKHNLKASQRMIAQRLVALYTSDQQSTLEVILGAKNLDDLMNRLDNAKSVTSSDASVLGQVNQFRTTINRSAARLKRANAEQSHVVAQRAAAKAQIESKIGEEQHLYHSIQGEIAKLVIAQRAEQLRLQAQAEARLRQQQAASSAARASTVVGISVSTPENDSVVLPPPTHGNVIDYAMSQLGTPYVWGGGAPGGFDCSGLVMWAYAQVGVSLPHSSYAMWNDGVAVPRDQLQPGDIVFFDGLGHVGLYIGGDQFIEAPHTGDVVKISSLDSGWYSATYVGARRIL
jgi:cell wall-associated NlpC family hydrolase